MSSQAPSSSLRVSPASPSSSGSPSVSSTFGPNGGVRSERADIALYTSDGVTFFVHSTLLLEKSTNQFGGLFSPEKAGDFSSGECPMLSVAVPSNVLNVVLHTIYEISPFPPDVPFDGLAAAVDALAGYGIPPHEYVRLNTPLFQRLALNAADKPIQVYTLAASHDLTDLAVFSSSYSLGTKVRDISDAQALRMGPYYLLRLLKLQANRTETLKRLMQHPPARHSPVAGCDSEQQELLSNAWRLVGAYFIWDTGPELTTLSLEMNVGGLEKCITCESCKVAFRSRLAEVLQGWEQTKRSI